jgi:HK97 family phage major capsid protein
MPSNRTVTVKGDLGLPTDLPSIMREIRKLARLSHRTTPEDVRFYALCSRSKSINAANRAGEARAPKRSTSTATPTRASSAPTSIAATEAEIRRVSAKGDHRTLAEDRYLKDLQARAAKLSNDRRKADTDLAVRAAAKLDSSRRASATPGNVDPLRATAGELRDAALNLVEREGQRFGPDQLDHLDRLLRADDTNRDSRTIARRILMSEAPAYRSAFWKSVTQLTPAFSPEEVRAVDGFNSEFRAGSEGGSFGLAVPAMIDPTIVPSADELAPIVAAANNVTITSNVYRPVSSDGSGWAFQSEGAVVADNTPVLAQPVLDVEMARAFIPFSQELQMDYPGFADEFARLLGRGYTDLLSSQSAVGTAPNGLFTDMASTTTNPAHVVVTTAGHIGAVDLRAAWSAVPERFRSRSTWVMHSDVLSQVRNIAGAASQVDVVVDRLGTSIMGRPVITSDYCPDFTGTTGAENFLVVGDLSGFTVAQRCGVTVELVQQLRDNTGRPIGSRGWLAYARVAMGVTVPPSMRLLANS